MPRDTDEQAGSAPAPRVLARAAGAARAVYLRLSGRMPEWLSGLSAKLLALTLLFVMLAEVLIFVPSIANFRATWLGERLGAARLASLAAEAAPKGAVPARVRNELLGTAQVRSVAIKLGDVRREVLPPDQPLKVDASYDLRPDPAWSAWEHLEWRLSLIGDALAVFLAPEGRTILVMGHPAAGQGSTFGPHDFVEIVLPQAPLRAAMVRYALNILGLSVIISMIAAALVYLALNMLLVRPMMRITRSMLRFSEKPEDPGRIIAPSPRRDEIGTAERELAHLQREVYHMLHQKSRLAELGLAVSKINHDLRNMLASAQLISDRLGTLPDPAVQRFAPKLIDSLDRAIAFCNDILRLGRAKEAAPRREVFALATLVAEVADGLGLPREGIDFINEVDPGLLIDADRAHLYRVLNNLGRNAVQAIAGQGPGTLGRIEISAVHEGRSVACEVRDTGPGIPEDARANLFRAFQSGNGERGGTGLGLVIAAELVAAHGGELRLVASARGAAFRFDIPDRPEAAVPGAIR